MTNSRSTQSPDSEQIGAWRTGAAAARGFVLPLVLWIIAILGLVIAGVNDWVGSAVQNAQVLSDKIDAQVAFSDIRNEIVYLLATRPKSTRGLEIGADLELPDPGDIQAIMVGDFSSSRALALDGRPYLVDSNRDFEVHLQDANGLIRLNTVVPAPLERLLGLFEIPESARTRLIDVLRDFTDEDTMTRLSGAEEREYRLASLRPPPDQPLLTPYHAKDAIGWNELVDLWRSDQDSPLLTSCVTTGFNPNTAPEIILRATLPRITAEGTRALVERRQERAFRNQREVARAADVSLLEEPFFYSFLPGNCMIVDVVDRRTQERTRYSLTLVPFSKTQPWRYDYEIRLPRRETLDVNGTGIGTVSPEILPAPESLFARLDLNG